MSVETWVTPLGHSFTCEEEILRITPNMSVVLLDVEVEAFTLKRDNSRRDSESTFIIYDNKYKNNEDIIRILSSSSRHWSVTILVPSIYIVVFLVALPLNIMAIIVFLVKMKVRKPAVVYMLNLATADVLLISILPFYIVYRFMGSNWIFGEAMCHFVMAAFYCNMYCSVLLMTSISVDRFLGIVYPVRSLPWRTVTRAWLVCGVIWVISLASFVPLLIQKQTITVLDITMCHDSQHFGAYYIFGFHYFATVFSVFNFLPLFITTFCYVGIIRGLSRSKFDGTHKRSRAIRLSVVVLSVFLLCFGPTNAIYLIYYQQLIRNMDYSLYCTYILSSTISSINCCLDPLIYYFASSECQRYVYSLLRWKQDSCPPVHKEQSPLRTHSAQFIESV
ncbi:proteinase-activated receptor 1-like [Lithobates pipiens]